jgi:hypothetical protein
MISSPQTAVLSTLSAPILDALACCSGSADQSEPVLVRQIQVDYGEIELVSRAG